VRGDPYDCHIAEHQGVNMAQSYKATAKQNPGRKAWLVEFRHPLRTDANNKPGKKIRKGLGTEDTQEAHRLVEQLTQLLADQSLWSVGAQAEAAKRYDGKVVEIFYGEIAPRAGLPLNLRDKLLPLPGHAEGYARVALMGDSSYAARVTEIAVKNTKLPVSVKLRAGLQSDEKFLVDFVKRLESVGAAWITLHPRTAEQKRRGSADWNQIRLLKSVLKIPVVGNGDIQCPEDISAMMDETGCDRVMIGRALLAKPWLISYSSHSSYKELDSHAEAEFYGRFLKRVLQISRECYPEEKGLRKIRFLLYHGSVWLEYGHTLYALMKKAKNYQEASDYLEAFFLEPRKIFKRTALRH
jgi:hypothetical protein